MTDLVAVNRPRIAPAKYTIIVAVFGILGLISDAGADDNQGWTAVAFSGPAGDNSKFLLWFDGHARYRDNASELDTTIFRPGIGWRATQNLDLWLGYARVISYREGPDVEEDRIWQQASYPVARIFGGQLSGRTRLEQRSRDVGSDTGWRLRQFWRWARPIPNTNFSFVVANETFLGLNNADWGQRSGYDQNRAMLGLAWQIASKVRAEGGYLNNHIDRGPAGSETNHNVAIAIVISL